MLKQLFAKELAYELIPVESNVFKEVDDFIRDL